ncbi:GlxA family transcriptional regulator [Antarctobacter jejuensis]|uniref:GlxA family transcriptional regulator n=1 Tax=Antarctobacter jejuensis TaxID=1439938 RepID=UPI003FD5AFB1
MHFVFVIEPSFTMQAFSSAIEVLRLARKFGEGARFSYSVASLHDGPVPASNGIEVLPNRAPDDLPRGATVVVVAGAGVETRPNPELLARLRRWSREGHPVWAIASGVVRLAQAGLADGGTVAPHWEDIPYLREHHPRVEVATSLFVLNAKHPTCAGGGASADLMLNYIANAGLGDLVDEITSRLMIDGVRDGRMKQALPAEMRYATSNRACFAAIRLMEANLFDPLPLTELARRAGVSQRQLERVFKTDFGKTPKAVYSELRLAEARQEILAGHRSILDIALDYGFEPAKFSKTYRRIFGVLPSKDRR